MQVLAQVDQLLGDSLQDRLIETAIVIGLLIVLYLVLLFVWRRMMARFEKDGVLDARERRYLTLSAFVRRILVIGLLVLAVISLLTIWGVNPTALLAVGGAVGIGLGFGAQNLVRDVIAGFLILAEDQYRIGDVIDVAGVSGEVEDINIRLTILRDSEGNVHYVPNGLIGVASNRTQEYADVRVDVGVGYREDIDRVLAVVKDELHRFAADEAWKAFVMEEPKVQGVQELGDSAVIIRSLVRVEAPERFRIRRELLRRIKNRFDAEGIEIPFPTQTVLRVDVDS